ncbi:hypothetical protein [Pyrobaculum neutrophilum]|uniref:Uncharacterized protein n=1 Tax=Pyrobaculum neutrophilum (strain DSM 2338 / JCM 9278 / NBRC 100436 / V24Sta) TaxID=444157 RepID=B1Y9A4_PYRNV|nr:hypothetical protein [Pyrobaculum neutrophilum]ACB40333.1 conserved hypothetical protein [Pyrobaculum neutrophilum V24Sta]
MYAFVDTPFSPSGVTHLVRLHRAVGFEKELQELEEVLRAAKAGNNNVLAVVIAPYGWGKSELLDEVERAAAAEGFDVVRTALSLEGDFAMGISKKRDKPLLVLLDEADEISRIAAVHKLGALSDEKFVQMIQKVATYIRALLEPRSYRHLLGDPERYNKIVIVAALTPQLYYTILKNVIPDVFDITAGRVYREIVIDTRFPFWQYVETVKQRLLAYSKEERLRKIEQGDIDPLSPFTLRELAALYHLARRKGEAAPRPLMKLTARLFQMKKEGRGLAHLLREEGINPEMEDEVLELAFAGVPHDERTPFSKEVYLYRIPYVDRDALAAAREYLIARGKDLDLKDPKNVSYEPNLYYSLVEDGKLYVYLAAEEDLGLGKYLLGKRYLVSDDVAKLVGGEEVQTAAAVAKELGQRFENPHALLEEVGRVVGVEGIHLKLCCGYAVWLNNMGVREGYLYLHVDREEELKKAAEALADVFSQGSVQGYVVDYVNVFLTSRVLLTETIYSAVVPALSAYWKRHYREPVANYVSLQIYGADKLEKLKYELIKYQVDKLLKRETKQPEFIDAIRLGREKARSHIMRYTLALRKGKEKKQLALIKAAEALDEGGEVEGLKSYRQIEEILLNAFETSIHERELRSLVHVLFPVQLWREVKEDDVVELMKLRGVLVPNGERLVKYNEEAARRHIENVVRQIEALGEVKVEVKTPLGDVKLSKKIDTSKINAEFNDRKSYAKALREAMLKLLELRDRYEEVRRELEREAEEKSRLLKRLAAVLERYLQRSKFIDIGKIGEVDVKREESIAQRADEALRLWNEIKHMARHVGSGLDVEKDLATLLELPEPWLDDYIAALRLYAYEISKKYERQLQLEKERKTALEWLQSRFGVGGDLEEAVKAAALKAGVSAKLVEAVARRGRGAVLDVDALATETGLRRHEVEEGLEKLYKVGAVEKRYVA